MILNAHILILLRKRAYPPQKESIMNLILTEMKTRSNYVNIIYHLCFAIPSIPI